MARKRMEKPPMPVVDEEVEVEMKAVRLYLPADGHWALRKMAAEHKTNMSMLARQIVMEYLAKHAPKGGRR
jgi:hypothetical protein